MVANTNCSLGHALSLTSFLKFSLITRTFLILDYFSFLSRTSLFSHMSADHGFNVGLPDNLGIALIVGVCDEVLAPVA